VKEPIRPSGHSITRRCAIGNTLRHTQQRGEVICPWAPGAQPLGTGLPAPELAAFFADPVEVGMNNSLAMGNESIRQPILRAVERGEIAPEVDTDQLKPLIDVLYRISATT
jgi:hypothetical protein